MLLKMKLFLSSELNPWPKYPSQLAYFQPQSEHCAWIIPLQLFSSFIQTALRTFNQRSWRISTSPVPENHKYIPERFHVPPRPQFQEHPELASLLVMRKINKPTLLVHQLKNLHRITIIHYMILFQNDYFPQACQPQLSICSIKKPSPSRRALFRLCLLEHESVGTF